MARYDKYPLTNVPVETIAGAIANAKPLPNWTTPPKPTAVVSDVRRYAGPPRGKTGNTQIMLEQFAGGIQTRIASAPRLAQA
jgi:hypothetical protein